MPRGRSPSGKRFRRNAGRVAPFPNILPKHEIVSFHILSKKCSVIIPDGRYETKTFLKLEKYEATLALESFVTETRITLSLGVPKTLIKI